MRNGKPASPFLFLIDLPLTLTDNTYSNQADLKLLEDMGITPSRSIRERRPSIKTVGLMVIFLARVRKFARVWGEKKKVQEQLALKLEGMRARKVHTQAQGQKTVRRSLPLGMR
jgi:hypothetical protein